MLGVDHSDESVERLQNEAYVTVTEGFEEQETLESTSRHVQIVQNSNAVEISSKDVDRRRQKDGREGEHGDVGVEDEQKRHISFLSKMQGDHNNQGECDDQGKARADQIDKGEDDTGLHGLNQWINEEEVGKVCYCNTLMSQWKKRTSL